MPFGSVHRRNDDRTRAAQRFNLTQSAKSENRNANHEVECARRPAWRRPMLSALLRSFGSTRVRAGDRLPSAELYDARVNHVVDNC